MWIINEILLNPKKVFSSLLRVVIQTYKWTCKHLPLMLRSTEVNTVGKSNTQSIRVPSQRGNLLIERGYSAAANKTFHLHGTRFSLKIYLLSNRGVTLFNR